MTAPRNGETFLGVPIARVVSAATIFGRLGACPSKIEMRMQGSASSLHMGGSVIQYLTANSLS